MLLFNISHFESFNYIIHHFLLNEIFFSKIDIDNVVDSAIADKIETIVPKYIFREQYLKCLSVFRELFYWTEDSFYHQMTAFHEMALYYFLIHMSAVQKKLNKRFDKIYFNKECHRLINELGRSVYLEDGTNTLESWTMFYYDVFNYADILYEDTDFVMLSTVYNNRIIDDTIIEEQLGIDIDYYYDLLPLDIKSHYKTGHITLKSEISNLLSYLTERINYGNLYKLFWEGESPINEKKIQLVLENIMDAFFYNQEVDISREVYVGNGQVDFKLYRSNDIHEKVLIEIKKANSYTHIKKGYENQLTEYMLHSKYQYAFYLVACFTNQDYDRITKFIKEHIYTNSIQMYINIGILDLRQRKTPSARRKGN